MISTARLPYGSLDTDCRKCLLPSIRKAQVFPPFSGYLNGLSSPKMLQTPPHQSSLTPTHLMKKSNRSQSGCMPKSNNAANSACLVARTSSRTSCRTDTSANTNRCSGSASIAAALTALEPADRHPGTLPASGSTKGSWVLVPN
jgi:hypothetical protein